MDSAIALMSLVFSVPALVAALWSAIEAHRLRRIESDRDAKQEQRDRQEQAREVSAWMSVLEDEQSKRWFLTVVNSSANPVFQARTEISARFPVLPLDIALVPPGTTYFELPGKGKQWEWGRQLDELERAPRPLTAANVFKVSSLAFTDAAGNRWHRDDQGRLTAAATARPAA